ncbi:translation initiation factor IF-2 [Kangiella koreensis]|uniref:Translation initiation factor IF-2 n=1 Tax=Kangiella koreensis (strain DSM 16069 / JCM 12317 / KCTC 12182 / SW-125) TaxID=523791 RepID=C7R7H7_KANKD|nr:translation initiation factor IF-2 [Kangiella koreensis]ACV25726.1 translation initiation factor IF-2 [Kangiella koreensis DSM 16069]
MSKITVRDLADTVKTPVEKLMEQLSAAGIKVKGPEDGITDEQKKTLLTYLQKSHGGSEDTGPKKITLNRTQKSTLSVTSSEGKRKSVQVAVKKKRTYVKRSNEELAKLAEEEEAQRKAEEEAKRQAEEEAKRKEEEAKRQAEEEAKRKEEEAKQKADKSKKETQADEPEDKPAKKAEPARDEKKGKPSKAKPKSKSRNDDDEDEVVVKKPSKPKGPVKPMSIADFEEKSGHRKKKRKKGKKKTSDVDLVARALEDSKRGVVIEQRVYQAPEAMKKHGFKKPTDTIVHEVEIPETITVGELAKAMTVKAPELMKAMMKVGVMATINQSLDQETASLVVEEMGHKPVLVNENQMEENALSEAHDETGETKPRAPVVTIMGHVDHGKTSLLDYIRATHVASGEAGGITQHIGAYHVETDKGMITFLDTPGHAAFTAMRARGAEVTDIVILIVAADDGVMPQTIEAVQHAKAAGVPMIVAVNKIDKEESDPERVKNELSQHDVIPEDWGGDVQFVHVSAKSGEGVDDLLDSILLQSEVLELKATDEGAAKGFVIEARLDKGRGAIASILVQKGQLHKGDILLAGTHYGRVRALLDENGEPIESAGPSIPVEVLGLSGVPVAGDEATVVADERTAREIADRRESKQREAFQARQQKAKLENMFANMGNEEETQQLNIIIKADVQGSLEALNKSLTDFSTDEVEVKVISSGVGGIKETDVSLAAASNAIIIGFNVRADSASRKLAEKEAVDIRYYSVIYEAIEEVKAALGGMLSPESRQEIIGLAEVRDVFKSPKLGAIAGCMVVEGVVKRHNPIRVLRDDVVIYEGELESLRRFKDDVNEVRNGMECGIGVKNYNDVKPGDKIEVFQIVIVERTL